MSDTAIQRAPATSHRRRRTSDSKPAAPRPPRAKLLIPVGLFCTVAITWGYSRREEYLIVPEEGLGYGLGIAGLAMMTALLLYSLRKRWSGLSRAGAVRHWFHIHMALGLLGPTAILQHANYQLGSLNANVALACMLTVSLSGIVGRFIYTRIHYDYRGHVASFVELREAAAAEGGVLQEAIRTAPEVGEALESFRRWALADRHSLSKLGFVMSLGSRSRATRRRALRAHRKAARSGTTNDAMAEVKAAITDQVRAVRRVAEYGFYERAFSLWHVLHLPFCFGLFTAAAVHVVAVHMY